MCGGGLLDMGLEVAANVINRHWYGQGLCNGFEVTLNCYKCCRSSGTRKEHSTGS